MIVSCVIWRTKWRGEMFMMKHVDRSNCHTFVSNTVIWWKQKYMVAQTFDVSNRS
jgi:hypothetical protein